MIGWWAGIDLFYVHMIKLDGNQLLYKDLFFFLKWILLLSGTLAIWAAYNYFRFRKVERRMALAAVTNQELSTFFGIETIALNKQQLAKYICVRFDEKGTITEINN